MTHVGEQVDKILSISIDNPNVLKSLDVLMISPKVLMVSPDVLMMSPRCTEHSRCTEIPDVLNTHCTG